MPPANEPAAARDWEPAGDDEPLTRIPTAYPRRMPRWVRAGLVIMAVGLTGVFITAAWIRPYDDDGTPKRMATHTQLGMAECSMVQLTGKPCPSCGMTTSFSLLIHGDVPNSARANWVGTLLAAFGLFLVPWGAAGAYRGRLVWVRNGELFATVAAGVILTLMLGRWGVILLQR